VARGPLGTCLLCLMGNPALYIVIHPLSQNIFTMLRLCVIIALALSLFMLSLTRTKLDQVFSTSFKARTAFTLACRLTGCNLLLAYSLRLHIATERRGRKVNILLRIREVRGSNLGTWDWLCWLRYFEVPLRSCRRIPDRITPRPFHCKSFPIYHSLITLSSTL
jgi:hypothetical protein